MMMMMIIIPPPPPQTPPWACIPTFKKNVHTKHIHQYNLYIKIKFCSVIHLIVPKIVL